MTEQGKNRRKEELWEFNTKEPFATGIQAQITQKIVEGEAGPPKYATSLTAQITQPHLQIYNRATVQLTFLFQMYRIFCLTLEVETVSMENIARMVQIQTRTLIHWNISEEIIFSVNITTE